MRIDAHTHIFHPKIADKVLHQLENHYSIPPIGTGIIDDLMLRLDNAGLDKAVVLTAATAPAQVRPANNWAIQLKQSHPELIPFGTIHPDCDTLESELERLERNGIQGLKFHPDFQGYRLDDPKMFEVMELIQDRFICLFHVGDALPPDENPSCPKKLATLCTTFPDTTIIAAHMGGYLHWKESLAHLAPTNVLVDSSSVTSFVDDDLLKQLFNAFGHERILFGSDYPLFDAQNEIEELTRRLGLTEIQLDTLFHTTATLFDSDN